MGVNNYSSWLPVTGTTNGSQDLEMGYGQFFMGQNGGGLFDLHTLDADLSWYNYDVTDVLTIKVTNLAGLSFQSI